MRRFTLVVALIVLTSTAHADDGPDEHFVRLPSWSHIYVADDPATPGDERDWFTVHSDHYVVPRSAINAANAADSERERCVEQRADLREALRAVEAELEEERRHELTLWSRAKWPIAATVVLGAFFAGVYVGGR